MKRLIIAALAAPASLFAQFALIGPSPLLAQSVRDSVITVSATRTGSAVPDRVAAFVIVEGTGETPADANTRLDTKLKTVTEAIRALGSYAAMERPLSYGVSLSQNQAGYAMAATPTTYISRSVVRLQITRLEQMSQAIASIIAAGAANVGSLQFESSAVDSVRREKLAEAIATARADAQMLASALGGKLGPLVDASTSNIPVNPFGSSTQLYFDNRFSGGSVSPPTVVVNSSVTLRFRFIR